MSDHPLLWPLERAAEAVIALAREARIHVPVAERAGVIRWSKEVAFGSWLTDFADRAELEIEELEILYAEIDGFLSRGGPALVEVFVGDRPGLLLLLPGTRRRVRVLSPAGGVLTLSLDECRELVLGGLEAPFAAGFDVMLEAALTDPKRLAQARVRLMRRILARARVRGCYSLRSHPSQPFARDILNGGVLGPLAVGIGAHFASYALGLVSWIMLGQGALGATFDRRVLVTWVLVSMTAIPIGMLESTAFGMAAIRFGAALKRKLLVGSLRLDVDALRSSGVGEYLGRVIESEAVESLVTSGGFAALIGLLEIFVLPWIMAKTVLGTAFTAFFVVWVVVAVAASYGVYRLRLRWAGTRIEITRDLVERMVGHRTRLGQQPVDEWHEEEDIQLAEYTRRSNQLDVFSTILSFVIGKGFFVIACTYFCFLLAAGALTDTLSVAAALGTILLVDGALGRFVGGLQGLFEAAIAGSIVWPLYKAAHVREAAGEADLVFDSRPTGGPALAELRGVTFAHSVRREPVLREASLRIEDGDRILVEGPSGGGKSTMAALLTGLRSPSRGLVLYRGLDSATVGLYRWRSRMITVPQFHENYVLTESLAFNMLLGREFPPSDQDRVKMEKLTGELGLSELVDRMPGRFNQMVGESGWQLSHGERSRLFIARALMQDPDLVVLDESLGALDPETHGRVLDCVLRHAKTLLVIAHP